METRRKDQISLLLISFLGLFYELAFIRWLPANVLSLAYFANVVLISCFLGIGLGCMLSGRRDLFGFFPWLMLAMIIIFLLFRNFEVMAPSRDSEWIWISDEAASKIKTSHFKLGILPTLVVIFSLNTALFVPIGQRMGALMEKFEPLRAYSINILGSVLGVAAFAALSFVGGFLNSPELWFGLAGLISLWFFIESRRALALAAVPFVLVTLLMTASSKEDIWSPYYSIQLRQRQNNCVALFVNKFFHQEAVDFNSDPVEEAKYSVPYFFKQPKKVLVLGAGTGNDVAIALRHGATEVTAVEIDPMIVELGRHLHPCRPYDHPGVRVVVDDARSFLKKTREKFDMIVFGTLDSHALLSGLSTVRLDNYVYTVECLEGAKKCLADDGIAVLMFSAPVDWIGDRLIDMSATVFKDPHTIVFLGEKSRLFGLMILAGPGVQKIGPREYSGRLLQVDYQTVERFMVGVGPNDSGHRIEFAEIKKVEPRPDLPMDDWPYLYLKHKSIPAHYLKAIALMSLLSIAAVYAASPKANRGIDLNFFSLGCAFMLLETKCVTTLSLIFGSTWIVNAFVFGAILLMILLANAWVLKRGVRSINAVYALLGMSLLLNYVLPVSTFLGLGYWARSLLGVFWAALPMFFSAILFAVHFRSARNIGWVFGSNLVGAVLGGFLEYSSMATGLNFLFVMAAVFYLISFLSTRGRNFSAELSPAK